MAYFSPPNPNPKTNPGLVALWGLGLSISADEARDTPQSIWGIRFFLEDG